MTEPRTIEINYRGQRYSGQWWIDGATLHVTSAIGSAADPLFSGGRGGGITPPLAKAKGMLWDFARANDPKRPFFYLRPWFG